MATERMHRYVLPGGVSLLAGTITLSPVAVAQATTAEQTLTVKGLKVGDQVHVTKPTAQAGLGIVNARCSADDTLAITFANVPSGGNITPTAAEVYVISAVRLPS